MKIQPQYRIIPSDTKLIRMAKNVVNHDSVYDSVRKDQLRVLLMRALDEAHTWQSRYETLLPEPLKRQAG